MNMKTEYAGLTLRNPLIVGSSGLTNQAKRNKAHEEAGAGAVVLKSLFEEQIEMQSGTLVHASDFPEAADYVASYVKANQLEKYIALIEETKALCHIPVIASINCCRAGTWVEYASRLEKAGADALELNVFYLHTDPNDTRSGDVTDLYTTILRGVKKAVSIPVIMKIGKNFSNIPALVSRLKAAGADGVVLFNRYYQPDIDINRQQIVSGKVFSSHSDLSDTLRWTALTAGKVQGISVASSTGVHDGEDVVKCLLAGASAVQLCSTVYMHGPEIIPQMLTRLEEWMMQNKYLSLKEFIGKLSFAGTGNPSFYERAQFMKYFSDPEHTND
ncbi:MAG: dihydroorotate dehydrogenase-like protein [Tannerella sp.]|jgi:dihydroorotate dehydrogenase (fumarate)|nr:dihydroorotate dehydrogenase-like protein [Tannerella sp.]